MRAALPLHLFGRHGHEVGLEVRHTSEEEWARGAASLVLREVFRPPIYETGEEPVIDTLLASRLASRHSRVRGRG
jgi:hypothetical protein